MTKKQKHKSNPKRKDITAKRFLSLKDVFATACNGFVFKKPDWVTAKDIVDMPNEFPYHVAGKYGTKNRDILKKLTHHNVTVCLIGVENQSEIDPFMPIRVMGYDWLTYLKQVEDIIATKRPVTTPLIPAITIVLYFGIKTR